MKAIWKFPIEITDEQVVEIPFSARVLSAQFQGEQLCLWALVEVANPKRRVDVWIVGTGHSFPERLATRQFVGTAQHQVNGTTLVWHVFVGSTA